MFLVCNLVFMYLDIVFQIVLSLVVIFFLLWMEVLLSWVSLVMESLCLLYRVSSDVVLVQEQGKLVVVSFVFLLLWWMKLLLIEQQVFLMRMELFLVYVVRVIVFGCFGRWVCGVKMMFFFVNGIVWFLLIDSILFGGKFVQVDCIFVGLQVFGVSFCSFVIMVFGVLCLILVVLSDLYRVLLICVICGRIFVVESWCVKLSVVCIGLIVWEFEGFILMEKRLKVEMYVVIFLGYVVLYVLVYWC